MRREFTLNNLKRLYGLLRDHGIMIQTVIEGELYNVQDVWWELDRHWHVEYPEIPPRPFPDMSRVGLDLVQVTRHAENCLVFVERTFDGEEVRKPLTMVPYGTKCAALHGRKKGYAETNKAGGTPIQGGAGDASTSTTTNSTSINPF